LESFDYVVIGGGSAACVLAYRLGEAGKSVCVLEAGPPDSNPYIRMPAGFMKTLFDPKVTWQFKHQPSAGTNGRKISVTQGRTLGGSSSVNGAVYNRGQPADFDGWAQFGNLGWSYQDVLPYFRRSERYLGGGSDTYRGRDGRLPVTAGRWTNPACEAFVEGAVQSGIPRNPDYNGQVQAGVGYYQSAIYRNERWSAARAFLHPARRAFAVTVRTDAPVTRIVLDGKRAIGAQYRRPDRSVVEVRATRSVIVSAGTANTPKLLQLSGIGPAPLLKQHGIDVIHELPGVGANFRDHFSPRLVARAKPGVDSINSRVRGLRLGREMFNWMTNRPSVLAVSPVQVYAFWKSEPSMGAPDFAVSFTPGSYKEGVLGRLDDFPGMTCGVKQMRPESRGYVHIASADDRDDPILQPNFLDNEYDRRIVVRALKCARGLLNTRPMQDITDVEILPGPGVNSDDEWLDFAHRYGNSGYHLIGTAKMGPTTDTMAVVDPQLRVHGLEGLCVVDASVMPTMPSANTYAAVLMIAEKASDMLLKEAA
jgi:choline dehydrogenase